MFTHRPPGVGLRESGLWSFTCFCGVVAEHGDAVPFGLLLAFAGFVFPVAGSREGEAGNGSAALGVAGFGVLADVAREDCEVLHGRSPFAVEGLSLRRLPKKVCRRMLRTAASSRRETPKGQVWVRAGAKRQHGPADGVAGYP